MTGAPSASASSRDTLALWLTLRRLSGVGTRTQHELLEHFGSVENIFSASRGQLENVLAGKRETVNAILDGPGAQTFQAGVFGRPRS